MKPGEKYKNIKRCLACNIIKPLDNNFRIVNATNGYTSKTCRTCEALVGISLLDDTRPSDGVIYLLFDSASPEYIKIGYTVNKESRLHSYNQCRPLNSCSYVYVSKLLPNIVAVEKNILSKINTYAYSTPDRNEWFSVDYKERFIAEIKAVEVGVN